MLVCIQMPRHVREHLDLHRSEIVSHEEEAERADFDALSADTATEQLHANEMALDHREFADQHRGDMAAVYDEFTDRGGQPAVDVVTCLVKFDGLDVYPDGMGV